MITPKNEPSFDLLDQIDTWGLKYCTFFTALELNLFTIIHSGNHSLSQIAKVAKSNQRGVRAILEALCSLGLLKKHKSQYHLTATSKAFLVRGSPTCSVDFYLAHWPSRAHLTDSVRTGKPQINIRLSDYEQMWADYTAIDLLYWQEKAQMARERWQELGITSTTNIRILDAACGSGIYSFVCAQDDPTVQVTCLDLPKVLKVSEKLAIKLKIKNQVKFIPGDLLQVQLPHQHFDVVWFGAILYYFSPEELNFLFLKTKNCLKPGGRVVIRSVSAGEDDPQDEMALLLQVEMVHLTETSYIYNFLEYKKFLEHAGFGQVRRHSNLLVSAIKQKGMLQ